MKDSAKPNNPATTYSNGGQRQDPYQTQVVP